MASISRYFDNWHPRYRGGFKTNPKEHGTPQRYYAGCHCAECRAAAAKRQREKYSKQAKRRANGE